jgi:hypothetical protein
VKMAGSTSGDVRKSSQASRQFHACLFLFLRLV